MLIYFGQEYGEDIELAFEDYDNYIPEKDENGDELKRRGIEKKLADDTKYNINAMIKDISRDRIIARVLIDILEFLGNYKYDDKISKFAQYIERVSMSGEYGKKVLVFSFFADTINYLKENLGKLVNIENFESRSEFISGQSGSVESIVRRFSPVSKKYSLKDGEKELDFLFSTDILSEGQNLQDAGILINYDLHWNPVRMIQRNGRINRLGSSYDEVLISNMNPESNIELYLNLLARLQTKISIIKHTVGLDQGVLSNDDINPIEFVEDIRRLYSSDKDIVSKVLEELDEEADILSWTNDHIYRLREFLNDSDEVEIQRIKDIPVGKWGYLPLESKLENSACLSLQFVEGKTSITNKPIEQTFFIKTTTEEEYPSEIVEEFIALQQIQTTAGDNNRILDKIVIDREIVKRRAMNTAKRRA